jgi:hypothetical protein
VITVKLITSKSQIIAVSKQRRKQNVDEDIENTLHIDKTTTYFSHLGAHSQLKHRYNHLVESLNLLIRIGAPDRTYRG